MKHFALIFLLVCVSSVVVSQPRRDISIDAGWKFTRSNPVDAQTVTFDDRSWEEVSLPHTWNAKDGQDGGGDYYRGTGWYRRHLRVDEAMRGRSLFLKFDGAATTTQVYVNGTLAGTHRGNFGAFCFHITPLLKIGSQNVIAVRVNNARDSTVAPLRGDFTVYGGIYRKVHLLVLESLSISPLDHASPGVYIRQADVNAKSANLEITTVVRNASPQQRAASVRCLILDKSGKEVARVESPAQMLPGIERNEVQSIVLPTPHFWNGRKDPYLYQVTVEVREAGKLRDRVLQPLGVRSFSVDPDRGFSLNGSPYRLQGVTRHQDRENKGWAIGLKEHEEDFRLIEEVGATAIRLAHYQHAQEFYDLCDRGGMVVWAELALVDDINPSPAFAATCTEQLKELIKQNYNHPSIMFWSLFNELIPDADRPLYGKVVADLHALAKELDPTRLTTMASRSKYDANEYINTVSDVIGYNVYRGWYEGKPEDFARFVDTLHQRYPKRSFCISEYGAGASVLQHEYPARKPSPRGPWHPEEWQAALHETTWKSMLDRPFLWGTFLWNMFDFGSDGRAEGDSPGRNDKGLVTFDRKVKKDAFYWYKANWNPDPMVRLTSSRYSPRPSGPTSIKVYSNCESVELLVNGTSLGSRKSGDKIFLWNDVELARGVNKIEAVGSAGGKILRDSCTWIGS